jgi:folate-dependent tRNA-U54 methylase TrmFO/GidA
MNVNFGLFPPLDASTPRGARKQALCARALCDLAAFGSASLPHAAQ